MIADKNKPYKRECFASDDDRFKKCDAVHGILDWCNNHENFIEIITIIKTKSSAHFGGGSDFYELIYREW